MDIDRNKKQNTDIEDVLHKLDFVLSHIEGLEYKCEDFFSKTWGDRLTYEEIIGALVFAEQLLKEKKRNKIFKK